jgi:hypothetical protein
MSRLLTYRKDQLNPCLLTVYGDLRFEETDVGETQRRRGAGKILWTSRCIVGLKPGYAPLNLPPAVFLPALLLQVSVWDVPLSRPRQEGDDAVICVYQLTDCHDPSPRMGTACVIWLTSAF